jgi:hypothetical protein
VICNKTHNTNTGWFGPYDSGTGVTKSHTWSGEGTYTIKCKAKDPYEAGGTLTVTMPRNRATQNTMFLQFLEWFPILRLLLLR